MNVRNSFVTAIYAAVVVVCGSVTVVSGCLFRGENGRGLGSVEVSFDFTRQKGWATNQFAVWIEDLSGEVIKTLFVTDFTGKGGWDKRKDSLCEWVNRTNPSGLTDTDLDAYTGATPWSGRVQYVWDCTDSRGKPVPPGNYSVFVEGTLRWKSHVLYNGTITVGSEPDHMKAGAQYFGECESERTMLSGVVAEYIPR